MMLFYVMLFYVMLFYVMLFCSTAALLHAFIVSETERQYTIFHNGSVFHDGFTHDQPAKTGKYCKYHKARHHSVIRICSIFEAESEQECIA